MINNVELMLRVDRLDSPELPVAMGEVGIRPPWKISYLEDGEVVVVQNWQFFNTMYWHLLAVTGSAPSWAGWHGTADYGRYMEVQYILGHN